MDNTDKINHSPEYYLAKYASELSFDDIDKLAKQHISHLIFDAIAISIGAYNNGHQSGLINENFILENYHNMGSVRLWSGRGKMTADLAALCNGTWTEVLDFQDVVVDPRNNGHLGVTIIPAACATAEREGCSGAKLITAVAAGLEASIAVLRAVGRRHRSDGRGFRTTSLAAPLGAAVACAKLLDLGVAGILNAMGIAGACSPNGLMPSLSATNGSFGMDKDWVNGQAAQLAVNAADLAARGMTASDRVATGEMGIIASHSHGDSQPLKVPEKGAPNIGLISLKKFAACYGVHSAMEATLNLIKSHDIKIADIGKIIVRVKADSAKTLSTRSISNHMAARFSLPYAVASAAIRGDQSSLEDFEEPAIFDKDVLELMKIIEIVADPDLTDFHSRTGGFPAHVEIKTKDASFDQRIDYPVGSMQRPMTWQEIEEKFIALTTPHFSIDRQQKILEAGRDISKLISLEELTSLF
ncbi:MAG: MmgE/PrpD family protein [Alphaproteobacteria bacterium]|nr:MmgE/PrpD family protein [Alphaproteobacteria bacterium]HPF46335.1 MmgE/PrpD family protein [Emcibacteraceae bacterium]